jgi:hypothetical protein
MDRPLPCGARLPQPWVCSQRRARAGPWRTARQNGPCMACGCSRLICSADNMGLAWPESQAQSPRRESNRTAPRPAAGLSVAVLLFRGPGHTAALARIGPAPRCGEGDLPGLDWLLSSTKTSAEPSAPGGPIPSRTARHPARQQPRSGQDDSVARPPPACAKANRRAGRSILQLHQAQPHRCSATRQRCRRRQGPPQQPGRQHHAARGIELRPPIDWVVVGGVWRASRATPDCRKPIWRRDKKPMPYEADNRLYRRRLLRLTMVINGDGNKRCGL